MRRPFVAVLPLMLAACVEPEPEPFHYDPEEIIARAVLFADELERLDADLNESMHIDGMGLASIWADPVAADHFRTLMPEQVEESEPFPVGTLIVKSNFNDDGTERDALNILAKFEPGYNPSAGDWYFAAITRDGEIIDGISGKGASVAFCIDCHGMLGENSDYVVGLLPEQLAN